MLAWQLHLICAMSSETGTQQRCTPTATIVADFRERASGIPELLRSQGNLQVFVEHLQVGDYLIDDRVVVERKTLNDFVSSVIDTRVFRQAARLNSSRWRPALLLEGRKLNSALPRNAFIGALVSLALVFNIPVLRSRDVFESAFVLSRCAVQLSDAALRRVGITCRKPKRTESWCLHVLTSLPLVGEKTARQMIEHFGTLERCINATEEELRAVPGVGVKTARELRRVITNSYSP